MTTTPPWAKLLLAGTLIATLSLTTSCSLINDRQAQKQQTEQAHRQLHSDEENRLEQELSKLEHVTQVGVGYTDVWPESGHLGIDLGLPIEYRNEETKNRLYNDSIQIAWSSRISPLDSLVIRIHWHDPKGGGIDDPGYTPLLGDKGRAELTQRYGPRPS